MGNSMILLIVLLAVFFMISSKIRNKNRDKNGNGGVTIIGNDDDNSSAVIKTSNKLSYESENVEKTAKLDSTVIISTDEKAEFNVLLKDAGETKLAVIKVLKEATGLGLKETKELVESLPKIVKENLPKADAEKLVEELKAVGAMAELQLFSN